MKNRCANKKFNRYMVLPALLDLIRTRSIVLLDPLKLWEDKNDVAVIREYVKRNDVPKVFVVCFAIGHEIVHHWKAYADGPSGCCIEFDREKLLQFFPKEDGFRYDDCTYEWVKDIESTGIETDRLPFTKRKPYQFENEYRIIWGGNSDQKSMRVNIELSAIRKITLSPLLPADIYASMKQLLRQEIGDSSLKINHSTLYKNKRWITAVKKQA